MIKQYLQNFYQSMVRIKQATTKGVFLAYLLLTIVIGVLVGIGMSAVGLVPPVLIKVITAYGTALGSLAGILIGALAATLVAKGKNSLTYFKQVFSTRRVRIVVPSLSLLTILLFALIMGTVTVVSAKSDFVSIPLTPYMGKLVLTDPLHDNSLGYHWTASPLDSAGCVFTTAGYKVSARQSNSYESCFARQTNFSTFAYQADVVFVQGAGGGLIFLDGDTGYNVAFDSVGQFLLFTFNPLNHQQDLLAQGYPTGYIGYNRRITVTLIVKSDTIEVYLGRYCVTCNSPIVRRLPSHGAIGVFALIENGQPESQTDVLFENVEVWNL